MCLAADLVATAREVAAGELGDNAAISTLARAHSLYFAPSSGSGPAACAVLTFYIADGMALARGAEEAPSRALGALLVLASAAPPPGISAAIALRPAAVLVRAARSASLPSRCCSNVTRLP